MLIEIEFSFILPTNNYSSENSPTRNINSHSIDSFIDSIRFRETVQHFFAGYTNTKHERSTGKFPSAKSNRNG